MLLVIVLSLLNKSIVFLHFKIKVGILIMYLFWQTEEKINFSIKCNYRIT